MINLMKLEWKKNKIGKYIINMIVCIVCIFAVASIMAVTSGSMGDEMFEDYTSFMSFVNILIRVTFIVFAGVLLANIVIEEYRSNTISVLCTYPIQRKKVMQAKLFLVVAFCFASIMISTIVIDLLVLFLNPMLNFFTGTVTFSDVVSTIPYTIIVAIMCGGISLIPLYFGMKKKSTSTTITSSVIVGILINATVSDGASQVSLSQVVVIPLVLCLIGLTIGYLSYCKIDVNDIG